MFHSRASGHCSPLPHTSFHSVTVCVMHACFDSGVCVCLNVCVQMSVHAFLSFVTWVWCMPACFWMFFGEGMPGPSFVGFVIPKGPYQCVFSSFNSLTAKRVRRAEVKVKPLGPAPDKRKPLSKSIWCLLQGKRIKIHKIQKLIMWFILKTENVSRNTIPQDCKPKKELVYM